MRKITFPEIIGYIFKFVAAAFAIIFMISLFLSFRTIIERNSLEKFGVEVSENILGSKLTEGRAVFLIEELEKYDDTTQEPYARGCQYGYRITLTCLEKDICNELQIKESYKFGFDPAGDSANLKMDYPVAIKKNGIIVPARMKLEIFYTPLTETSCIVEKAYKFRKIYELNCLTYLDNVCITPGQARFLAREDLLPDGTYDICSITGQLVSSDSWSCTQRRRLPEGIRVTGSIVAEDFESKTKLRAIPVPIDSYAGLECDLPDEEIYIPQEGEEAKILLCYS